MPLRIAKFIPLACLLIACTHGARRDESPQVYLEAQKSDRLPASSSQKFGASIIVKRVGGTVAFEAPERHIEVNIEKPALQASETETVRIEVGHEMNDIAVFSDKTVYEKTMAHDGSITRIQLVGKKRR
jgi:hypothetical protein